MMIGVFVSGVGVLRGGLAQSLWWFSRVHHLSTRGIAASHRFLKNMTFFTSFENAPERVRVSHTNIFMLCDLAAAEPDSKMTRGTFGKEQIHVKTKITT